MDLLLTLVGLVVGSIALLLAIPPFRDLRRRRRDRVRQVVARLDAELEHETGRMDSGVYGDGVLMVRNSSEWSVTDVIVVEPEELLSMHFEVLGPGEVIKRGIPQRTMVAIDDLTVTLQVTDDRSECWEWTPDRDELVSLSNPPIRLTRWLLERLSDQWQERFFHYLPKRVTVYLWGEDPATGEKRR